MCHRGCYAIFRALRSAAGGADEANGTASNAIITTDNGYLFDGVAHGHILCIAPGNIIDGETVTISDGTTKKVFEFDKDNSVTSGNVPVNIRTAVTSGDVRDAMLAAINAQGGYGVDAYEDASNQIVLINAEFGTTANQRITETVADVAFGVQGMDGGEIAADGFDFSAIAWKYIRIFDGTGAGQVAEIQGKGKGWVDVQISATFGPAARSVFVTGSTLMYDSSSGGVHGLSGYVRKVEVIPASVAWITEPNDTSRYLVVTDSFKWRGDVPGASPGTTLEVQFPALWSVFELTNDFQLGVVSTSLQFKMLATLNSIQTAMGSDAGGSPYLRNDGVSSDDSLSGDPDDDFLRIPLIFFGEYNNGPVDSTYLAYIPGLANVQPADAGTIVFPRPFTVSNGTVEIFQEVTSQIIGAASARFADDWDGYHMYEGEVHCATAALREIPVTNWWEDLP